MCYSLTCRSRAENKARQRMMGESEAEDRKMCYRTHESEEVDEACHKMTRESEAEVRGCHGMSRDHVISSNRETYRRRKYLVIEKKLAAFRHDG